MLCSIDSLKVSRLDTGSQVIETVQLISVVLCVAWQKLYKPPEMQLEAFAFVLAFQAGRPRAKLMSEGQLKTEHMREITNAIQVLFSLLSH